MITDQQVKKLTKEYQSCGVITMSALKSGMHRETAAKYLVACKLPSELKKQHDWKTHKDIFEGFGDALKDLLKQNPDLHATTLLEYLQERYPGVFTSGHLRTLQRRVKEWKFELESEKEVIFLQDRYPGKSMQLDWTCCNELGITIGGESFNHLLCHSVLVYSGWEWATVCLSESFLSLCEGFQEAVFRLGHIPKELQTDNSSAATHRINLKDKERTFNDTYKSFLEHFDVEPHVIHVGCPNENGSVESANGHLKRRLKQQLILRGSSDFNSVDEYKQFLENILEKLNRHRLEKLKEELALMRSAPPVRLPHYRKEQTKVSRQSMVRLQKVTYSVPSKYIGRELLFHIYESRIEAFYRNKQVFTLPRLRSDRGARIDYRHIIHSLRRKPGAFSNWKYHNHLFPTLTFRQCYDHLGAIYDNRRADREYLDILSLAADYGEKVVEGHIQDLLAGKVKPPVYDTLKSLVIPEAARKKITGTRLEPSLKGYDHLLKTVVE
ncbi:MAG: IS21 family transposase [Deltaproteobacteria bacterium]|nr:IS21 family transposase [Deltaproteobacteria bacterium]